MYEDQFDATKHAVLNHIQQLFQEMEAEMAISHQEKYALLEDVFESATDTEELYVAYEQWYNDHADDLELEHDLRELWDNALVGEEA